MLLCHMSVHGRHNDNDGVDSKVEFAGTTVESDDDGSESAASINFSDFYEESDGDITGDSDGVDLDDDSDDDCGNKPGDSDDLSTQTSRIRKGAVWCFSYLC